MNNKKQTINNTEGALLHCGTQELYDVLEEALDLKHLIRGDDSKDFIAGVVHTLDTLLGILINPEIYFNNEPD